MVIIGSLTLVHLPSISNHYKKLMSIPVSFFFFYLKSKTIIYLNIISIVDLCKLEHLRAVYSTGSPLKPESFDFVYEHIKKDVMLGSITGGTDICSLFAGHNCALPVYRGEIQSIGLGMNIQAWADVSK